MSSTIAKYLEKLSEYTTSGGIYAYRGQSNADWDVESAAYRRLKRSDGDLLSKNRFISYHIKQILEPARMNGYGKELSDLELLAELQHHGAATCLIDFTREFLVALWFACQTHKKENGSESEGKIFILDTNNPAMLLSLEQKDLNHKGGVEAVLNFQTRTPLKNPEHSNEIVIKPSSQAPIYWHWSPHGINQRILKQNSLFVFGEPCIDPAHLKNIPIPPEDKNSILKELRILGITRESLFKDMPGFAASHGHDEPILLTDSPESYFKAGNQATQENNMEKAIKYYSKAIEINPGYGEAYFSRGNAKAASGDYQSAIEDYDKAIKSAAIEYRPDLAIVYNNRGSAKSDLNNHQDAIADYDKAIELYPSYVNAYHNRGNTKLILGNHQDAMTDYDKVIELNPNYVNAYYNRGNIKLTLGIYRDAIADYDKVIKLNPNDTDAYCNRGNVKSALGNHQDAMADYDKAIEINPNDAYAYCNRGNMKFALGNHQGAMADYDKAIEINPNDAMNYYNRGNVKFALGNHQGAMADYDKAIELKPDNAEAYYNRGYTKEIIGDHKGAKSDYLTAVNIRPDSAKTHYLLGNIYIKLSDTHAARENLQRAKELAKQSKNNDLIRQIEQALSQLDESGDGV